MHVSRYKLFKRTSVFHLNVQMIVKDSKTSDGNDYRVENNRFPLAGADCRLAALRRAVKRGC